MLICVHNSLILLAISDLSVVVWSPSTINHQRRSHTNNNGFRFCCRIPRASDSISRRIFYHPMYAPLSIFFYVFELCLVKKLQGFDASGSEFWVWFGFRQGFVEDYGGRVFRASFECECWFCGGEFYLCIYWNFVNLRFLFTLHRLLIGLARMNVWYNDV